MFCLPGAAAVSEIEAHSATSQVKGGVSRVQSKWELMWGLASNGMLCLVEDRSII